jgi:DNA-binding transcriptional LysR family regulator
MSGLRSLDGQLDWNDVRYFLAVARRRTLARAAAALGVDQTTVGRRIASLEARLGVSLFTRSAGVFQPSRAGRGVLEAAERMEEAALELRSRAAGEETAGPAVVRVATTESLAEAFVVPAVQVLRTSKPGIQVTITTGWAQVDLRKGEADLAVRLVRPTDPRLACRKLADFRLQLYASREYLSGRPTPTTLAGESLIAYEDAVPPGTRHPFARLSMEGGVLALLSNSHHVLVAAAAAGAGIVQLPSFVGDAHPDLVRVFPEVEEPYSVWQVLPQANRRIASVRAVSEAIAAVFRQRRAGGVREPARVRRQGR